MSDLSSFTRQWQLLRMLCSKHAQIPLRDLSQELGVSTKTISRDLDTLRSVGFPIVEAVGYRGLKTWSCQTESMLAGLTLTFEEATALYLGRRFLEPLAGTALWDASQTAYQKIRASFGEPTLRYLEKLTTLVHFSRVGIGDYSTRSQILDTLMIALEDCRPTRLLYHSIRSGSAAEAIVHPHGLVYHRAALYLVAFVPAYDELRHYKVDRMRDAEHLDGACFTRIEDFDLRNHFASSFGIFHKSGEPYDIRIQFARKAARYVEEHHWHESQQLTIHPDGSATLQLQLTSLEEIKSWVMSFGASARVEEPKELREMMKADLEKMSRHYISDGVVQESKHV